MGCVMHGGFPLNKHYALPSMARCPLLIMVMHGAVTGIMMMRMNQAK